MISANAQAAVFFVIALGISPQIALGTTHFVKPDGSGDYINIGMAVVNAASGDTLELDDGVFAGGGNRGIDLSGLNLVIRSRNGDPEACTINLGTATYGFNCGSNDVLVFENLQIINGAGGASNGGAITCDGSTAVTITSCIFADNTADHGGAILGTLADAVTVTDCRFARNTAVENGAGISFQSGALTVTGSYFSNGEADKGGGIHAGDCDAIITNCSFSNNTAGEGGGFFADLSCDGTISNCTFTANSAESAGGIQRESTIAIEDCTFAENEATAGRGGGIRAELSSASITDCTFSGNTATEEGGAYYSSMGNDTVTACIFKENSGSTGAATVGMLTSVDFDECTFCGNVASEHGGGATVRTNATGRFDTCTFYGNSATVEGGGLYVEASGSLYLDNIIISHSVAGEALECEDGTATINIECCDFYDNAGGDWVGEIAGELGSSGNISADPLYCDAENDDFSLSASSTCAYENAGSNCGQIGVGSVDCGIATAVCCLDETCQILSESVCDDAGGVSQMELDECSPNPCLATAACCQAGECVLRVAIECGVMGGEWHSEWTTCDPNPCPAVAACCHGGLCHVMIEEDCTALDGDWQSAVSSCTPDPCPAEAACCTGEMCTVMTSAACTTAGGTWHAGYGCGPSHNCALLRACCVSEACTLTWLDECEALSGQFIYPATTCDPDPCSTPVREISWGRLKSLYR